MSYFSYAYKQSEKGIGKAFLFSLLLGLIFAISILVILVRSVASINGLDLKQFADETGCSIVNYELTCNEDYYEYDGLIVDLNQENDNYSNDNIILKKDVIILDNQILGYQELLGYLNHGPDFNVNDFEDYIGPFAVMMYIIGFVGSFFLGTIFFIIGNTILALIMMWLINAFMKTNFKYEQMYKLTFYTVLPYVTFNALTRMIFWGKLSEFISPDIPLIGWFIQTLIDYLLIFILTYLAIKSRPIEPVVEFNTEELQDE